MILIHTLLIVLLADLPSPVTAAVARYNAALNDVQAKKKGSSVQRVFEAALAARAALEENNALADLSDEDRAALQESIPALRLRREPAPAIESSYFVTLAEKRGSAADADFFTTLGEPELKGGCTRFADGALNARYKAWFAFSRKHKSAYRAHVIEQIERIEDEITKSTCACEDAETVKRALMDIVRDFPLGKITPRVRQRIHDVDRGTSDIQFECGSPSS